MEAPMNKTPSPAEGLSAIAAQGIAHARVAMENYLKALQQCMSASPWAHTEMNRKLVSCAERNISAAFDYAGNLTSAKDPKEFMKIQTEFAQQQTAALSGQAKEMGEIAIKETRNAFKVIA
jgi:hypothetical protein